MAVRDAQFELLTPRGPGGVAVVAVYGRDRWRAASRMLQNAAGDPITAAPRPRRAVLVLDGRAADEVLLVDRVETATLEIHLHGSPAVVTALGDAVGGFAEAFASPAEQLLRTARTRQQIALALEQRDVDFAAFLREASRAELTAARERSRIARAQIEPRRVVLCGAQNSGKSTLMNRLLFQERVLTGDLPGLTRDPVREGTMLDGYPYELVDTAGEGAVLGTSKSSMVDRAAIERGRHERRDGLLLLVVDGSRPPSAGDRELRNEFTLVFRSKTDLSPAPWPPDFAADVTGSCLDPQSAATTRLAVGAALRRLRRLPPAGPVGGPAALTAAQQDEFLGDLVSRQCRR